MERFTAELGTVSHATMRSEDLIPRFIETLDALKEEESLSRWPNVDRWTRIDDTCAAIEQRLANGESYHASEESSWDIESLFDLLEEYAPDGCYFGAHEGDGSDYGFWECEDTQDARPSYYQECHDAVTRLISSRS